MDIAVLNPVDQIRALCEVNGPITMLVAMQEYFQYEAQNAPLPGDGSANRFAAHRTWRLNLKIANGLDALLKNIAATG